MAFKLSIILDGLQQQLLLLNELVARVAACPTVNNPPVVQQLYSDFPDYIAITQLLSSRSSEDGHSSAELDAFAHVLQTDEPHPKSWTKQTKPAPSDDNSSCRTQRSARIWSLFRKFAPLATRRARDRAQLISIDS